MEKKFKQTEIGKIPEDWEIKKISEIGKVITGKTPPTSNKDFFNGEYPFIKIPDMNGSVYLSSSESSLSEKGAGYMKNLKLPEGSVMVSCLATIGKVSITKKDSFTNQQINSIIPNKEIISPLWIYYFFKNNKWYLESLGGGGSVYTNVSKTKFENASIPLPPLPEQLSIAKILSSLDAKIELNNKMNKTIEEIGQAIFKKWFIDNPEKEGWEEGKLGELGAFKNGINYLRDEEGDTEFSIVNVRNISNNKYILNNSLDKIRINYNKAKDYILKERDIIIARSACPGKVSLVLGNDENIIYSGFSIRYRLNGLENYFYLSFILENLQKELTNFSIGTTLTSVNQEVLKNIKIKIPDDKTLKDFNKIAEPIFKQISTNCFQNQTLSQIRDALLPKLLSGEVRVK